MSTITNTNPFIASHINSIIEGIRLLEAFVTSPLGLYSDIRMLRESQPFPGAADLPQEEAQARRQAYRNLTDRPLELALDTISSLSVSLDALSRVKGDGPPLDSNWVSQARRVLARARQRVAGELRSRTASRVKGLYVIVDPEATKGRPVLQVAEAVLRGGASMLQLRDKKGDKGDVLPLARQLRALCEQAGALFIMNDHADLALASGAHGLHVGQTDLPVEEARRVLLPTQLVGRSNNNVEEAMTSQAQGVDYLAVGAVFPTATMGKSARKVVGLETLSKIKGMVSQPLVAIGGINAENIADVVKAGADCVCVVSAVTYADNPEAAARQLVEAIQNAKK